MSNLVKLNEWLLADIGDFWTDECLDFQAMPTLKSKPVKRHTINELHAKFINGHDNLVFVAFKTQWRLVGVAYKDIISLHLYCLWNGTF